MIDPIAMILKAARIKAVIWHGEELIMRVRSTADMSADKKKELISEIVAHTEATVKSIEEKYND